MRQSGSLALRVLERELDEIRSRPGPYTKEESARMRELLHHLEVLTRPPDELAAKREETACREA